MKRIVLLTLVFITISFPVSAQNWFPLEVGNKWQYFIDNTFGGIPYYDIKNINVYDSIIINGKKYFLIDSINLLANTPVRFDIDSNKIFFNVENQDYLHMDFNIPEGQIFYQYFPTLPSYYGHTVMVIGGNVNRFNQILQYKGWQSFPPFAQSSLYILNFGEEQDDATMIQSILIGPDSILFYDHGYLPSITSFNPPDTVFGNNINLTLRVQHYYNRFTNPNSPGHPLNYISEVLLSGFYTNSNDTIPFQSLYALPTNNSSLWTIVGMIDTAILSEGYNLLYKLSATDKGIIPHTIFQPETGYYKLVYMDSLTLGTGNVDLIWKDFYLSQNYPNPFNPSTSIQYAIASRQFVTLKVYGVLGNEVATLVNEEKSAGRYEIEFNPGSRIKYPASGVYFYQLKAGSFVQSKKMVLLR